MSVAAVLVIVVAAGDAHAAATEALLAAARSALPKQTSVRLLAAADPNRVDMRSLSEAMDATAVATVGWHTGPAGTHALVRVLVAGEARSTERAIPFSTRDTASERGRTLGFAIAAMWPEPVKPPPRASPDAPTTAVENPRPANDNARPPETPAPRAPAATPDGPPAARSSGTDTGPPPPSDLVLNRRQVASLTAAGGAPAPIPGSFALGVGVVGAGGFGGPAQALGGTAECAWRAGRTVVFRGMASLRGGPIPQLPGAGWVAAAGVGAEWWPARLAFGARWALGARGDLLGTGHWVRRRAVVDPSTPAATTPAEAHGKILPAIDLFVRAAVRVGPALQLLLGAGVELALGQTDLRLGPERVVAVSLPPARGVADMSLRYFF